MKKSSLFLCTALLILAACGEKDNKNKFKPQDRTTSTLNAEDRENAIQAKRRALLPVDIDSMIVSHGVKFSVLPPPVTEDIAENHAERLASKMIQIAAQNGITGLCMNPVLAMTAKVDCIDRSMTGTAPQKSIVKYEVTMYCANMLTDEIYATESQTITGVGQNFSDATKNACNELTNDSKMQVMLHKASDCALQWYDVIGNVKAFVDKSVSERNYSLASALLSSVPQQSKSFNYAVEKNEEVTMLMFQEAADELYASMQNAINEGGEEEYNPQVGACMKLISRRSNVYANAQKTYEEYIAKLSATKKDKREKEHELALQEMEIRKIKAPFEAKAAMEEMKMLADLKKDELRYGAYSNIAASVAHGLRGGIFGENGMFGRGGIFGAGTFAEPLTKLVEK